MFAATEAGLEFWVVVTAIKIGTISFVIRYIFKEGCSTVITMITSTREVKAVKAKKEEPMEVNKL